uniref:GIY-YIG domain-containing protein n=1 Tax=Haemonchus contortus TaxID=6289 RepID=A0A7I4Z0J7_HAECO
MLPNANVKRPGRLPYIFVSTISANDSVNHTCDGTVSLTVIGADHTILSRACAVIKVDIPPNALENRLVRNRLYDRTCATENCVVCPNGSEGDCAIAGVVYRIICRNCGDEYIGETSRPLYVRVREHLEGKARSRTSTALGCHRLESHNGDDFEVIVEVVARETQTAARKTLEAFWIRVRQPKMNRRGECVSITRELSPIYEVGLPAGTVDSDQPGSRYYRRLGGLTLLI